MRLPINEKNKAIGGAMKNACELLVGLMFCITATFANAQSSAKELFVGVDGASTQLGSSKPAADGLGDIAKPAKPLRPKVLGLQTTIYQLFDDGGIKAVSPSTMFAGGSRIRLGFNANRAGYLYIVNVGSSGKVTTIFPTAVTDNNQIQPGLLYQIPQQTGKSIRFDTTPGEETILVVLAESRISDFEFAGQKIAIHSPNMNSGSTTLPIQQQQLMVASLGSSSTSKDLFVEDDGVFQTVVFNPSSDAEAKKKSLVTSLKLKHK